MRLKYLAVAFVFLFSIAWNRPGWADYSSTPVIDWQVGEFLHYDVKWSLFYLGSLKLTVLEADTVHGRLVYHCRINIDSNPDLPFVKLHDIYESYIDAQQVYSHIFISYERKGDYTIYTRYDFDYDQGQVIIHIENQYPGHSETVLDSIVKIPDRVQDSLSLLYYARAMVKNNTRIAVPVFAYNQLDTTIIRFTGSQKQINVLGKKTSGFYLDGRLKFVGIAGVKEGFRGWFSLDPQRVPLKAYMKAFVGSVRIVLKNWKHWPGGNLFIKQIKESR